MNFTNFVSVKNNIMRLPEEFIRELESYEALDVERLVEALSGSPAVSARANVLKNVTPPVGAERVKWCQHGWYLDKREAFTFDPAMHQGLYYVQDASSMILAHIVKTLTKGGHEVKYLDACAAPGGKTTAVTDSLPAGSLVVANEFVPARAAVLCENLTKWGYPATVVSKGDTARFRRLPGFFDIIGADVPCSGEGMFRKDAEAVSQWSQALVKECADRQQVIVANLWHALTPGGYLIYSTCTFNRHENEEMIDRLVNDYDALPVELSFPDEWNIARGLNTCHPCYRFMPHLTKGEGLFVAVLRKPGEQPSDKEKPEKRKERQASDNIPDNVTNWIKNDKDLMRFFVEKDCVKAFPLRWYKCLTLLWSKLDIAMSGITVAAIKGRDYIPTQSLASSIELNRDAFDCVEVDYETAIAYLRREAVVLSDGVARGYVLLTFGHRPLGFVKNLGNRANNLYPAEWRILSSHLPDNIPQVLS